VPKHEEFHFEKKFEKLMHLVGLLQESYLAISALVLEVTRFQYNTLMVIVPGTAQQRQKDPPECVDEE